MDDDEILATPDGLVHCLRMLIEEASILDLQRTAAALQEALDGCHVEVAMSRRYRSFEEGSAGQSIPALAIH